MKKLYFLMAALCLHHLASAQNDSTMKKHKGNMDTLKIGNVTIIKSKDAHWSDSTGKYHSKMKSRPKDLNTSWFTLDLGLNNYTDNTDYTSASAQQFAPGAIKDWFKLRPGKSVNVNLWFFMQRLNVIKHVVNLKYGLGLELNNYHYKDEIRFQKSPTFVYEDQTIIYRKNKLAADYITIPLMLNFNFTPKAYDYKSFGLSVGASAGYLYSSRQKYISDETGKQKLKDDFDLRPFKISYVAELKLGPLKLYGSVASRSMFEKGLDQTPYTMGIRLFSIY